MIVFQTDIPPITPSSPDQAHHNERLIEYQTNLHMHIEERIAKGEDPAALEEELEARKLHGQRVKDELLRRFYGTQNVSAKRFLDFVASTTLR